MRPNAGEPEAATAGGHAGAVRARASRPATGSPLEAWLGARLESCNRHRGLGLIFFAALIAIQISPWLYITPDAVGYLSIARSIAAGGRLTNLGNPHLAYPLGYPLILSPAFILGGRPFLYVSMIQSALAVAFMLGVYRWAMRRAPGVALLITGGVMVNVSLWNYLRRPLSELAFMALAVWTVLALNAALEAKSMRQAGRRIVAAAALLIALSMIREAGVLFAAGFGLAALWKPPGGKTRWGAAAAMALIAGLPAAAAVIGFARYDWLIAQRSPAALGTHLSGFLDLPMPLAIRFNQGLQLQIGELGRLLVPGMFKAYGPAGRWLDPNMLVHAPLLLIVAAGWWRMWRAGRDVYAATLPLYFGLYVGWALEADTRYLLPMLPVLVMSLWYAIEPLRRCRLTIFTALLAAHLMVAAGYWVLIDGPRAARCNRQWPAVAALAGAIAAQPAPVAAVEVPQCARLMLAFALDGPVANWDARGAAGGGARWIVTAREGPGYQGFRPYLSAGAYRLLLGQ